MARRIIVYTLAAFLLHGLVEAAVALLSNGEPAPRTGVFHGIAFILFVTLVVSIEAGRARRHRNWSNPNA